MCVFVFGLISYDSQYYSKFIAIFAPLLRTFNDATLGDNYTRIHLISTEVLESIYLHFCTAMRLILRAQARARDRIAPTTIYSLDVNIDCLCRRVRAGAHNINYGDAKCTHYVHYFAARIWAYIKAQARARVRHRAGASVFCSNSVGVGVNVSVD